MSNTNTGGPAYPTSNYQKMVPLSTGYSEGMTLRDYFAAKAMQGLLAGTKTGNTSVLANDSYKMADAMLKAREA
jgi:hypothetical protein